MVHLQRIVSFLGVCGKPFAIFFSARWLDSPYFSHVVRIMYLYVLKNVTACESHCSLPPNLEQRHGLKKKKKSLAAKTTEINAQKCTDTFKNAHINISEKEGNRLLPSSTQSWFWPCLEFSVRKLERGMQTACWLLLPWKPAETKGHKNEGIRWHVRIKKQNRMGFAFFFSLPILLQ